jgi:hypothetical protein
MREMPSLRSKDLRDYGLWVLGILVAHPAVAGGDTLAGNSG